MRPIAAVLLIATIACGGGGDRAGMTADSAVLQNRDSSNPTGSGDSAIATADTAPLDSAQIDSAVAGPAIVLLADSADGDVLYRRKGKCLSCHGLDGRGLDGLGSNLEDAEWLHGDGSFAFIQRVIIDGIARPKVAPIAMPAFATTLTPDEVYRITAYVYTLSHPGVAVADTTRLPIDTLIVPIDTIVPPADTVGGAVGVPFPPAPLPLTFPALPSP